MKRTDVINKIKILENSVRIFLLIIYLLTGVHQYYNVKSCIVNHHNDSQLVVSIAQAFMVMTLPISVYHSFDHWSHFLRPDLQAQAVRIIWMVPVFSIESYLSLRYPQQRVFVQVLREFYEAYVLYSFIRFLLSFLGMILCIVQYIIPLLHRFVCVCVYSFEIVTKLCYTILYWYCCTLSVLGNEYKLRSLFANAFPSTSIAHAIPFCFLNPWNVSFKHMYTVDHY